MESGSQGPPQAFELTSRLNNLRGQGTGSAPKNDPFVDPRASAPDTVPGSKFGSSTALHNVTGPSAYFRTRRIRKGEQERPWLNCKDPREKWVWIIPLIGILLGFVASGAQIYFGLQRISNHSYCSVLDEDWTNGFNEDVWTKEVEVGGFG